MNIETYLAFVLAAGIILTIPGPTVTLVVSQSIACGQRATLPLVLGVTLGDLIAMSASLLGLGAVLAASATLFTVFKWAGALYLIYAGIKLWRTPTEDQSELAASPCGQGSVFRSGLVITALNPKSIVFFVAFLPQFVDPMQDTLGQFLLLGATFLSLTIISVFGFSRFAVRLRQALQTPRARRMLNRTGGTALVGAGLVTAQQSS